MSIIEQAARRLEELRRAGVEVATGNVEPESRDGAAKNGKDGASVPSANESTESRGASVAKGFSQFSEPPSSPGSEEPVSGNIAEMPQGPDGAASAIRATIDLGLLAANGYVTPQAPRSRLAEQFRVIKRPLLTNASAKSAAPIQSANLIMVTSALPGEGKTFVAVNLAMSLAMEVDTRVLLVDADTSRPAVPDRLGLRSGKGLLDVLVDPSLPLDSVILATNVDRLSILPSGSPNSHATELLASDAMSQLVRRLSSVDPSLIVLFDTPPLLATTEARVLAAHMGQVILVVAADETTQATFNEALATVEACPVVMPLLNRSTALEARQYYGAYGSYGQ